MADGSSQGARGRSVDLDRLAAEFGVSVEELGRRYDIDLNELTAAARIRMFLPILVTRRLERALRRRNAVTRDLPGGQGPTVS